jgi:DNA-binding GntR family transcriptional regulator
VELDGADRRYGRTRQIADELRRAIIAGDLRPGERVTEQRVAREFAVSRIPVREAFRSLESEGFLTMVPNRGAVVATVSPSEAADFVEVRLALETLIVRRAAERRSPEDVDRLRGLVAEGRSAVDAEDWTVLPSLNTSFHEAVAQIAGNPTAARLASQLRDKIEWTYAADAESRAERSWSEHAAMVDAVAAGDGRAAERILRRHIGGGAQRYRGLYRTADER